MEGSLFQVGRRLGRKWSLAPEERVALTGARLRGGLGPGSAGGSIWTALKLKAMPATRMRGRAELAEQQRAPCVTGWGERLDRIFPLLAGTHGEKSRGDDHTEENRGKNEIVDHGEMLLWRVVSRLLESSSARCTFRDIALRGREDGAKVVWTCRSSRSGSAEAQSASARENLWRTSEPRTQKMTSSAMLVAWSAARSRLRAMMMALRAWKLTSDCFCMTSMSSA